MLPLTTHCVDITLPTGLLGDADDVTTGSTTVASGVACAIVAPNGNDSIVGGHQSVVDAALEFPPSPCLGRNHHVVDKASGDEYRIVWVLHRRGLGLGHQRAGLRRVEGAASG